MKKYIAILSIFALCACAKELAPEVEDSSLYSEVLTARIVNTKVDISDSGKFSWSEGDQIAVHRSVNGYETASLSLDGIFGVHLSDGETRDGYAIYPASIADENASDASNLAVILPNAYDIPKSGMGDYSPLPMVAVNNPASEDVLFHHLGGILRLELMHLPFETKKIAINLGKRVTGTFAVEGLDSETPFISLPDEEGEDIVFTVKSYITSSDNIIINVPVPVGTYNTLSYKIYDRYDNLMVDDAEDIAITIERADGYEMPQDLTVDVSRIPLCLKMAEVGEIRIKNPLLLTIEFSLDNENWEAFNIPEKSFVLKRGDCLYLRGDNPRYATGSSSGNHTAISVKAACYVYGNIMSLITPDPDDFSQLKTLTESYTFYGLFNDDTIYLTSQAKLLSHPSMDLILPATTLTPHCYERMFYSYGNCGISRMSLPAMELASYCYKEMFANNKLPIEIKTLPATTLAQYCYQGMFRDSKIVNAPSLPATTMEYDWYDCYASMFAGCSSLVNAPELPATVLASRCYSGMFSGCTSLVDAPELPATTLRDQCYSGMFEKCTSLVNAPELQATNLVDFCYSNMFAGCSSLVNAPELPATTMAHQCYAGMFKNCTSLSTAPVLPATELYSFCYSEMFSGCTSLVNAPELSATTLYTECYQYMFQNCTSLVNAPELPATLAQGRCYKGMFSGCTSLVDAPALPATEIANECYKDMFSGCTSLINAPVLPITDFYGDHETVYYWGESCYSGMFSGCTSLVNAPALPATKLDRNCYENMFSGCTSLVNAPELPALALMPACYAGMFNGCTSLNYVKAMFTGIVQNQYLEDFTIPSAVEGWLTDVAANGTYVMNEAATYDRTDVGVPTAWTVNTATE